MNKHLKNLSLGFFLSILLGLYIYSLSNNLVFSGFLVGSVIGGGVSVFLISLVLATALSFIYFLFKKSFWIYFYRFFWVIFIIASFFVVIGGSM